MLRHRTTPIGAARGGKAICALTLPVLFAAAQAHALDVSDGAILLAQHTPDTVPPAPAMDPTTLDVLLGQIDAFGFHLRNQPGGGMVSVSVYPVVLFRDGDALQDIAGLDIAHVEPSARHGAAWTRWRRSNGTLEIEGKQGWEALAFQRTYSTLPQGMRLDGRYRPVPGRAAAGTDSGPASSEYRFFADGRVIRTQGAGASSVAQDEPTASASVTPERHGRYRIEGLTLRIVYDDGRETRNFLVTDPALPHSTIWIDGIAHARRKH